VELESEQRRYQETEKNLRKEDRRVKDLIAQGDEDRRNYERSAAQIEQFQSKIKTFKRQVEEAEEIAAINLAKYRKVQHDLEESEERADQAEQSMAKLRAKSRASSVTTTTKGPGGSTTVRHERTETRDFSRMSK